MTGLNNTNILYYVVIYSPWFHFLKASIGWYMLNYDINRYGLLVIQVLLTLLYCFVCESYLFMMLLIEDSIVFY